jgi:sec-independent protein translocase protein TatA
MDFFGIGGWELLLILIVVFMIFGPHKLPEIAQKIGKFVYNFKRYSTDLNQTLKSEVEKVAKEEVLGNPGKQSSSSSSSSSSAGATSNPPAAPVVAAGAGNPEGEVE